jgi:outer membrane immunogenic protein
MSCERSCGFPALAAPLHWNTMTAIRMTRGHVMRCGLAVLGVLAFSVAPPAFAADMPARVAKAPESLVAPAFNWTGFYVGATVGGIWAKDQLSVPGFVGERTSFRGYLGGPTVGVNWQTGPWVFGVEGDYSWTNIHDEVSFGCAPPCREKLPYFATARVRAGYAANNYLAYLTGGAAFTRVENSQVPGGFQGSGSVTGWTIGAGLEGAISANWSWKVEYLFADFGNPAIDSFIIVGNAGVRHDLTEQVLRVGINYRFATGKAPAAAPIVTKN